MTMLSLKVLSLRMLHEGFPVASFLLKVCIIGAVIWLIASYKSQPLTPVQQDVYSKLTSANRGDLVCIQNENLETGCLVFSQKFENKESFLARPMGIVTRDDDFSYSLIAEVVGKKGSIAIIPKEKASEYSAVTMGMAKKLATRN